MEGRPVGESVERLIKFIIFGPVGQLDVLVASCYFDTLTNFRFTLSTTKLGSIRPETKKNRDEIDMPHGDRRSRSAFDCSIARICGGNIQRKKKRHEIRVGLA